MTDNAGENSKIGGENQRIGQQLYKKDQEQQQRYGYRGDHNQKWDEGNYFHTGLSTHGAQDRGNYPQGGSSHTSYNQGQNAHPGDHYGSRSDSPYRNEQSFINHGNREGQGSYNQYGGFVSGSRPGNLHDENSYRTDSGREGPGTRSRYKEDDYRYGSGSHNWYREGRYTPDDASTQRRDPRGFFQRVKDGWNDIMHSDDPNYTPHDYSSHDRFDRERRGSEVYRDRNFNRGYESGPRWADESDTGHDRYSDDTDRTQRYRR
ncbi:hypothetical protein [Pontibacter liquoris]|uniref:hypothetical protein n=1 Tax=Pontibacter liquoris TaxID=2905677 RepID=UPI001FA7B941|nr:hypothetical protein [Pontibacter liquoris]